MNLKAGAPPSQPVPKHVDGLPVTPVDPLTRQPDDEMTSLMPITTDDRRGGTRRVLAATLVLGLLLFLPAGRVFPQDNLPAAEDDLAFAKKLAGGGFPDLAVEILVRLEKQPGLDKAKKQELGLLIVDAYGALGRTSSDRDKRDRYLAMATRKLNNLVAELGKRYSPPRCATGRPSWCRTRGVPFPPD